LASEGSTTDWRDGEAGFNVPPLPADVGRKSYRLVSN